MALATDGDGGRLDVGPAKFLADSSLDGGAHEGATAAWPGELVDLLDELVVELYVHSHVLTMTHSKAQLRGRRRVVASPG